MGTVLIATRSAIASTSSSSLSTTLFVILVAKLALLSTIFSAELLGPDGWDGMTWRDFVPGVAPEGKIKLTDVEGEEQEAEQKQCPRLRANIFQILTFSWLTPMMMAGKSAYLNEDDLWALPPGVSLPCCFYAPFPF